MRDRGADRILCPWTRSRGIYRGEVIAIIGALADISPDTQKILAILGYDEEEDDEEMDA